MPFLLVDELAFERDSAAQGTVQARIRVSLMLGGSMQSSWLLLLAPAATIRLTLWTQMRPGTDDDTDRCASALARSAGIAGQSTVPCPRTTDIAADWQLQAASSLPAAVDLFAAAAMPTPGRPLLHTQHRHAPPDRSGYAARCSTGSARRTTATGSVSGADDRRPDSAAVCRSEWRQRL